MGKIDPPRLVTVTVFTTITIIFWIFFGVFNILTSDVETDISPRLLAPIDPIIKTQVLDQLPNKNYYDAINVQGSLIFRDNVQTIEIETPDNDDQEPAVEGQEVQAEEERIEPEGEQESVSISNPSETDTP